MTETTDLFAAIDADDVARVTALLAADPALAMARDDEGVSAVLHARYRFSREVVDALLAVDPDLDAYDAAALGRLDRLRDIIDHDPATATAFASDGFTALHLAAFFGKAQIAQALLDAGASPDVYSTNDAHVQALHSAAAGRHVEVCRLLLAAGADVNAPQRLGFTPLHQAAHAGDVELAELFLSAGADPATTMDDRRTPAETAEAAGHVDLAARLREVSG
jgi:ankyrin repeat protein